MAETGKYGVTKYIKKDWVVMEHSVKPKSQ